MVHVLRGLTSENFCYCFSYSKIHAEWKRQMTKVEPWGNRIIWYFAKDGGRKQVLAQRKAAKHLEGAASSSKP